MVRCVAGPTQILLLVLVVSTPAAKCDELAFILGAGKSFTTWHGQADVHSAGLEWVRTRSERLDLGLAVTPQVFWQPRSWFGYQYGNGNEKVQAIGVSAVARYYFASRHRIAPYVDVATGPVWAEKRVPAATSHFNWATEPGVGIRSGRFRIGYRFSHVSNGGIEPRNPGLNISSLVMGFVWGR